MGYQIRQILSWSLFLGAIAWGLLLDFGILNSPK